MPVLNFESQRSWRAWLQKHHGKSAGLWIRFYKKNSGVASIAYVEAVEEALCYGWIDSQLKPVDERSYLQRFSPRRPRSLWARLNVERAERLIADGRMQSAGLKEIEAAKADGRWDRAYQPPSRTTLPPDFKKALAKNRKAAAFFKTLNRANVYAICWRLETAKRAETRARRIAQIVAMLVEGKAFH